MLLYNYALYREVQVALLSEKFEWFHHIWGCPTHIRFIAGNFRHHLYFVLLNALTFMPKRVWIVGWWVYNFLLLLFYLHVSLPCIMFIATNASYLFSDNYRCFVSFLWKRLLWNLPCSVHFYRYKNISYITDKKHMIGGISNHFLSLKEIYYVERTATRGN